MTTTEPTVRDEVADLPRPEYPRPDADRSARWVNLNGVWDFEGDAAPSTIVVPFAWETEASGVQRLWLEKARYSRTMEVPGDWRDARVVLCFGAVHHRATVSIDGSVIGVHEGGYDSFELDVTDAVEPGVPALLEVDVEAPADKRAIVHGKQRSIPRDDYDGVSFTPSSGIWQTVWIEARGRTFARGVSLRGDSLTGFDVEVELAGDAGEAAAVWVRLLGDEDGAPLELAVVGPSRRAGRLNVADPVLWSSAQPHLYSVEVTVGDGAEADHVVVTGGLRRIEARGEKLFLNGDQIFIRGVLDQGYWPHSGLTAPTADDLFHDIELARDLGYNLVRKHLKFEEPMWLHEADRTGMLVWAEPACPSRYSEQAARAFEAQIEPMVVRDGNHPSIVIWGLYNEEWGLDWDIPGSSERADAAVRAYDLLAALDRTRPIVENSGWSHVRTDLVDGHYYEPDLATWAQAVADFASGRRETFPVRLGPDFVVDKSFYGSEDFPREGIPIVNSEYGEGFTSLERAWHLRWETQEMRRHSRFAGYVYTEFADVEHEPAGLLTEHRRPKDWGGCLPADVNAETVVVLDMVPLHAGADIEPPAEGMSMDLHVSHHGLAPVEGRVHVAWVPAGFPVDRAAPPVTPASDVVHARPFELTSAVSVEVPAVDGPARLVIWLLGNDSTVLARTFLDAAEVEAPNRRGARGSR